jgi:hypothetical protein
MRLRLELLVRALVVALIGSAGAFAVALWGGGALEEMVFGPLDFTAGVRTGRMIAFTVIAAFVAAMLAGLIPALRAPAHDLRQGMEGGGRTTTGIGHTRRVLVALQAAMSVLLLIGATLFVLSFRAAAHRDLGFDVDRLIMVKIERGEGDVPDARPLYVQAEAAVRSVPGVVSAARTVGVPFVTLYGLQARLPDSEIGDPEQEPDPVSANGVGADFFSTMGVPILQGRPIDSGDLTAGAEPVAVVSRKAAALLWPGKDPLGRCVEVGAGERRVPCARVVGLAESHVQRDLTEEREPLVCSVPRFSRCST